MEEAVSRDFDLRTLEISASEDSHLPLPLLHCCYRLPQTHSHPALPMGFSPIEGAYLEKRNENSHDDLDLVHLDLVSVSALVQSRLVLVLLSVVVSSLVQGLVLPHRTDHGCDCGWDCVEKKNWERVDWEVGEREEKQFVPHLVLPDPGVVPAVILVIVIVTVTVTAEAEAGVVVGQRHSSPPLRRSGIHSGYGSSS
jgi:hypothetical protein